MQVSEAVKVKHGGPKFKNWLCPVCHSTFSMGTKIKQHAKILLVCDICEIFNGENQRSVGMQICQRKQTVDEVDELPLKCEHCER